MYSETMPAWAKKVDEAGPRRWHRDKKAGKRRGECIGAIIWNLIWLYIANKLPGWDVKIINDHYLTVLPMINWNIWIQIGGNALILMFDVRFVRYLSRAVMEAASFFMLVILYYLYPFNFTAVGAAWIDLLLPWFFIFGMVVAALKVLSNLWKMIFWRGEQV